MTNKFELSTILIQILKYTFDAVANHNYHFLLCAIKNTFWMLYF